jgi:hypothetical protein
MPMKCKPGTRLDRRLTPEGMKADALQFGTQNPAPVFRRGRTQVDLAKREAAEMRAKLKLQPADPWGYPVRQRWYATTTFHTTTGLVTSRRCADIGFLAC